MIIAIIASGALLTSCSKEESSAKKHNILEEKTLTVVDAVKTA